MTRSKRILIISAISLIVIALDQFTKWIAVQYLPRDQMHSYFFDTVRIGYHENHGAFLGLGNSLPSDVRFWIFIVGVAAFSLALLAYLIFSEQMDILTVVGLSLVFAGGISNFYDRITNDGAVVDFLNVGIGPLRTGIFNIADMAILAGAGLVLLATIAHKE